MPVSLINEATKGVVWSAIERFSVQGIQFILSIIIARLVLPADYGLIAMLGVFLAVAQTFIDSGFSNALIQKKDRTEVDFSTVFYFNIVIGLIIYVLIYFASSGIASFYNEPRLILLTKVVGLNIVVSSFANVQRAKLTISLNFKLQAFASLIGVIIGGIVGIMLACIGYGVWALVFMSLLNNFLTVVCLWCFAHWIPSFSFSYNSFCVMFGFGSKLLLSGLLHTIYTNLYSLVIGKKMSVIDLGLYNRAYSFASFPSSNITDIMHKAMFPILCSIQDDEGELKKTFIRYLRMACYIVFPLMIILCALSFPLIDVLLTEKWKAAAPILQILCIAYMWDPVMRINNHILYVKGRTDCTLKAEFIKKIVACVILVISIFGGLYIICWGLVVYSLIDIFIITRYTKQVLGIGLRTEIRQILPVFLVSIVTGFLCNLIISFMENSYLQLLIGGSLGILFYALISRLLKFLEFTFFIKQIKKQYEKYSCYFSWWLR